MGYKAAATTGIGGQMLEFDGGWDRYNINVEEAGERIDYWDRQVSFDGTATIGEILDAERGGLTKYNQIAFTVLNAKKLDMKVSLDTEVELYYSGLIKELRVMKGRSGRRHRMHQNVYLGEAKLS